MKKWGAVWLALMLFMLSGCAGKGGAADPSSAFSQPSALSQTAGNGAASGGLPALTVTVLDLGKADAILIQVEDKAFLIDTGEDEDGSKVNAVLADRGISRLDGLLLTHLDKDHIGGVDKVLRSVEVDRLYQPVGTEDSGDYGEYVEACREKGIAPVRLTGPETLTLAGAALRLLPAAKGYYEDDNDYSVITEMTYGERRFLFAADAEDERLAEYLADGPAAFDFLKVPHHGRESDLSGAFLRAVRPAYAVVTCSKKKTPDESVLKLLEDIGSQVFLTSDGYVTAQCDGGTLTVKQNAK